MKSFQELGLDKNLLKVFEEMGFKEPTEIQEKVIPLVLAEKDVIAESATGSGKTLAFGAPIIEKIRKGEHPQVLILAPTRELAEQNAKFLKIFSKYNLLKTVTIYGGVALSPQIHDLEKADIVIGTPGRLLDHIARKTINLSKIKILVLDEADRMLDMGFINDVTDIISKCPKHRQTLLFSATISEDIEQIAKRYMISPVNVSAESYVDPSKLKQVFYDVPTKEKFSLLIHLLKEENSKLVMVFCNTKRTTEFIGNNLKRYGFDALALHGDLNQNQRRRILEHFHNSDKFILVCTDVAARGLDIKNVSHVYNYDAPKTSEEYIHRIGRTARAGKDGKAITLLSDRDYENFRRVTRDPSLNIENISLPEFEKVFVKMPESSRRGYGGRGGRGFGGRDKGGSGYRGGRGGRDRKSDGFRGQRGFGGSNNQRRSFGGGRGYGGRGFAGHGRGERSFGGRGSERGFAGRNEGGRGFRGRDDKGFRGQGERGGFRGRR